MWFSKDTFGLFGVHKQMEWSHFEPVLTNFGPSQGRKGVESGPIRDQKWLKNGSKPCFSKHDPCPVVVPKWMNTVHFEPFVSRSHPLSSVYFICGISEVSYTMFLAPPARSQYSILVRLVTMSLKRWAREMAKRKQKRRCHW